VSYSVFSLSELISEWREEDVSRLLSTFICSAEPEAELYLKSTSVRHERNDISRTYLIAEEHGPGRGYAVRGYFTLTVKCLALDDKHSIPDEVRVRMNIDRGIAQAYLLGQLAKADGTEKGLGKKMIYQALDIFMRGKEMFGCRVVRLDCKDELLHYYEACGFTPIGKNRQGTLNQMIIII